ncbi:uncharacterized protein LOC124126884 isoform X1 [Haliotis rufescens]|uniref:uncharacterized protein LOC124126884 isoform X1 n=1 Tax=Haliotis rufescens TaxID=6454 RepID=UPI00201F0890|nr:uncharacterized protein LOC124126884 isoform X1 [Haliotis rufescens]
MHVLEFPRELQYFILAKLDGVALGHVQCVCRSWQEIVGHLESSFNIWLRCCLKEIPSYILVELTGMCRFIEQGEITADVCNRVGWEFWRDLYREYRRGELLTRWQETSMEITIPFMYGKATSIDLGERYLVSGHSTGNVLVWENLRETDALTMGLVHKHHQHVSCVRVLASERSWTDLGAAQVEDACPCVASSSRDCVINVSTIRGTDTHHIAHFSQQVNNLSVCGEYFVAAAKSSVLHGQPVWRVASSRPLNLEQTDQLWGQRTSNVTAVAMTFGTVVSGDVMGNLLMWDSGVDELKGREPEVIHKFSSSVKQICLQGERLVCLLDDGSLWVRRDTKFTQWLADDLFETYQGTAKCLSLRGTILAVATTMGGVFLYSIPDNKSWDMLEFKHPDSVVRTGKNTITSISLGDDGKSPVVAIAADDETITIIRWQPF